MDPSIEPLKFSRALAPDKLPSSIRLLAPKDLPEKGITYHMNYLRVLWQRGDFPTPIKLSPRKIAWREDAIDAWIVTKSAQIVRANRAENNVLLAAEISERLGGTACEDGYLIDCPIPQWEGTERHKVLLKDDWRKGLVIKCLDGHARSDVRRWLAKVASSSPAAPRAQRLIRRSKRARRGVVLS